MSEIADLVLQDTKDRMDKAIAHAKSEFSSVRSGRAAPELVEKITVEAYGVEMRLQELASVSIPEARQLLVTPHDAGNLESVERGIINSDLGLAPTNDGRTLRLSFPALTEERRKELVKMVKGMAEDARVSLRNIRRDSRKDLDSAKSDGDLSDDELERANKALDEATKSAESEIDSALESKEAELLEV